jgi:hypothetical protein
MKALLKVVLFLLKALLVLLGLGVALVVMLPYFRCVAEGTLVETPSGPRPVEMLRVGDAVLAVAPDGSRAETRVLAVRRSVVAWWLRLELGAGQALEVTPSHPISTDAGWRPAGALRAGERIQTTSGLVPLQATDIRIGVLAVYDLSVDPHENFIAGGVVVHNKRPHDPELFAIIDLRMVSSAEVAYASANHGAYGRLECLAAPPSCGFPPGTTGFIHSTIASSEPREGYVRWFLAGSPAKGKPDPGIQGFVYVATPVTTGGAGKRGFAIDHTGLLCMTPDGSAPQILNGALAPSCTPLN